MQQATSSAQREPSMEEILASIRRIIEDSDAARTKTEGPPARQTEAPARPAPALPEAVRPQTAAPVERPRAPVIDVDAFRAELRGRLEPSEAKAAPAEAPKPRTLAEVQAEIMRGARGVDAVPAAVPVAERPAVAPVAEPPAPVVDRAERPAPAVVTEAEPPVAPKRAEAPYQPGPDFLRPPVAASQPMMVDDGYDTYRPEAQPAQHQAEAAAPRDNPKPAIISPRAGRQVAAAFGELSEAFAESRKKSFDEMAEQMLRPMLQDWLDNNLPTLVERLVREEIERVARGG